MVLLTLAQFLLEKTGGDSMAEVVESMARWRARLAAPPAGDGAVEPEVESRGDAGSGGDD